MFNLKLTHAVISSVARKLLESSTYVILFFTCHLPEATFCCYLMIQEISRYARNDNLRTFCNFIANLKLSSY